MPSLIRPRRAAAIRTLRSLKATSSKTKKSTSPPLPRKRTRKSTATKEESVDEEGSDLDRPRPQKMPDQFDVYLQALIERTIRKSLNELHPPPSVAAAATEAIRRRKRNGDDTFEQNSADNGKKKTNKQKSALTATTTVKVPFYVPKATVRPTVRATNTDDDDDVSSAHQRLLQHWMETPV